MATDRTIPTYQDSYAIKYLRTDDLYHCMNDEAEMCKANGKPATFKSLKLAKDFMTAQGAVVALPPAPKTIEERMQEAADALKAREKANEKACPDCGKIHTSTNTDLCLDCYYKHEADKADPFDMDVWNVLTEAEEAWKNRFETPLPAPVDPLANEEEVVFVGEKRGVGDVITDRYGVQFVATENSFYISARDAADAEDSNDVTLEIGWHTNARKVQTNG